MRGYKAALFSFSLVLLFLNVLFDQFQRRAAAGGGKIGRAPERVLAPADFDVREGFPDFTAGDGFHGLDQSGNGDPGRIFNQNMDMFAQFTGHGFFEDDVELFTDAIKGCDDDLQNVRINGFTPVFGDEDQVCMQGTDPVRTMSQSFFQHFDFPFLKMMQLII